MLTATVGVLVALLAGLVGCGSNAGACEANVRIPAEARSCEFLFEDTGAGVQDVAFGGGIVGEWIRQAPRTAVAFHADGDSSMGDNAVAVRLMDGGGYVVIASRCFDSESRELDIDSANMEVGCHD